MKEIDWQNKWKAKILSQLNLPLRVQQIISTLPELTEEPTPMESTYLYGTVGYGKTIYATQMLLEEKKRLLFNPPPGWDEQGRELPIVNRDCMFLSVPTLFADIKKTFNASILSVPADAEPYHPSKDNGITEYRILEFYQKAHLVVLDDFGLDKPTDWILQTLYLLINYRYDWLKKTIFTSNLSLPEVAEIYGDDRITSRIQRMCAGNIFKKEHYKS